MNKKYKKVARAIERLQKYRADRNIKCGPNWFRVLFAIRQTKETEDVNN
ncbi:MAG: hypothetical protein NG712_04420 [Omnitrophica bacterium]|nr:hypothetical protein [Candidatus Omnitrophota bacterium]